jgi:hypothetical protein
MGLRNKAVKKWGEKNMMKTKYIEFDLILGNGEKCNVSYCDRWGASLFGNRTIHFEFRDCLSISRTQYRSEFRILGENEKINPKESAEQIIEQLTSIKFNGMNVQQKLF